MAGEEGVLPLQRDRPHGALDRIVVDVDPAVVQVTGQPGPVAQRIVDRLERRRAAEHAAALFLEPAMQRLDHRRAARLADSDALLGRATMYLALDLVEHGDPGERFLRDRRGIALGRIEEAAAHMRPAVGERRRSARAARLAELAIGLIAVDLQDAAIVAEQLRRPHAAAAGHVGVDDGGWVSPAIRPLVADHGPEVTGPGLTRAWRQHLGGGLVDEQPGAGEQALLLQLDDRLEVARSPAHPVRQCGAIDLHALAGHDLRLPVER